MVGFSQVGGCKRGEEFESSENCPAGYSGSSKRGAARVLVGRPGRDATCLCSQRNCSCWHEYADSHGYPCTYQYSDSYEYADSHEYPHSYQYSDSHEYPHAQTYLHTQTNLLAYSYSYAYGYPHRHAYGYPHSFTHLYTDCDCTSDSDGASTGYSTS